MAFGGRRFKGVFQWVGLGASFIPGAGPWTIMAGSVLDSLIWKERERKLDVPDQKKTTLSPQTLVTSNAPIPLGFGTFKSASNILDFAIQRTFDATPQDIRTYFIAVGVSSNSAEMEIGKLGSLPFTDNSYVTLEKFPEGGESNLPGSARSSYSKSLLGGSADEFKEYDTNWVHLFSSEDGYLYLGIGLDVTINQATFASHIEVHIQKKVNGELTDYLVQTTDWDLYHNAFQIWRYVEKVPSGDYRITLNTDDWLRSHFDLWNCAIFFRDNYSWDGATFTDLGSFDLTNWAFQCNWFALKFEDEFFDPENANFSLVYNQGETSPITNLQNYMTDTEHGLSIPEDKINISSFNTMIARCIAEGRTFNGLFTSQSDPSEIINSFTRIAQALLIFSQNEFKLIEDKFTSPTKSFEEANTILDSFQYTRKDINSMVSRLKLDFEDSEHDYAVRSVLLDDIDLFNKIGIKDTSQFQTGVNTEVQAKTVGAYLFRNMRQPNTAILKTSINDADIEPGDMYEVIRPVIQHGAVYRAVEVSEEANDEIQVAGVSYFLEEETIEINTEDDFRAGTFNNTKIIHLEDGAVTVL